VDVGWLVCPTTTATDSAATPPAIRILVIKRSPHALITRSE
jgi:hypothetical protein